MFMQDVDGRGDLFAVEANDVLLQAQTGHFLQRAFITVLHEDVHLLLREQQAPGTNHKSYGKKKNAGIEN